MAARERPTCLQKAVDLLSRRSHFEKELRAKLTSRGYPAGEVDAAFVRLHELGYLDDARTAREWAEARLRRGPLGRPRLRAELTQRGADPELAAEVAAELVDDDDREAALEAASRTSATGDALARRLQRLGFSRAAVFAAVRRSDDGD